MKEVVLWITGNGLTYIALNPPKTPSTILLYLETTKVALAIAKAVRSLPRPFKRAETGARKPATCYECFHVRLSSLFIGLTVHG